MDASRLTHDGPVHLIDEVFPLGLGEQLGRPSRGLLLRISVRHQPEYGLQFFPHSRARIRAIFGMKGLSKGEERVEREWR